MKTQFTKRFLRPSPDGRTNQWRLTCVCGKEWEPSTTRLAKREEECPKCHAMSVVDYNQDQPTP